MKANINVDQQQQDLDDMVPVLHLHKFDDEYEQELYGAMFMYEDELMGINVLPAFLRHLNLTSIETVMEYTDNRPFIKPITTDEYGLTNEEEWGDLLGKGIIFICREGAFYWDTVGKEFVKVGNLLETVSSRIVKVNKRFGVCYGSERVFLEEGSELQLKGEYEHFNNDGNAMHMLIVKQEDSAHFVIPNEPQFITIGKKDLVLLDDPCMCGEC